MKNSEKTVPKTENSAKWRIQIPNKIGKSESKEEKPHMNPKKIQM